MKLIKINADHFIIVGDSEIKEGDWFYNSHLKEMHQAMHLPYTNDMLKITHSTDINNNEVYYIPLEEVKELIGEVDVLEEHIKFCKAIGCDENTIINWEKGYMRCLEDNKDKKYTEDDLKKAIAMGYDWCHQKHIPTDWMIDNFIQSFQSQTEWEVTFNEQGKLQLI